MIVDKMSRIADTDKNAVQKTDRIISPNSVRTFLLREPLLSVISILHTSPLMAVVFRTPNGLSFHIKQAKNSPHIIELMNELSKLPPYLRLNLTKEANFTSLDVIVTPDSDALLPVFNASLFAAMEQNAAFSECALSLHSGDHYTAVRHFVA